MRTYWIALGVVLVLAACGSDPRIEARRAAVPEAAEIAASPAKVHALLDNATTRSFGPHGNQIEFLAADGRTWLWYPGNSRVLPGRWQLQSTSHGLDICFAYGPDSHNPLTGQTGGWDCDAVQYYLLYREEIVAGDVLRLRQGLPFVLPKDPEITLAQAMAEAGFGPLRAASRGLLTATP